MAAWSLQFALIEAPVLRDDECNGPTNDSLMSQLQVFHSCTTTHHLFRWAIALIIFLPVDLPRFIMRSFSLHGCVLALVGSQLLAVVQSQLTTNSTLESPSNDMFETMLDMLTAEDNESPITYKPGQLTVAENGLLLSTGLQSRIIAITGEPVLFKDGSKSFIPFHDQPDAGAVFVDYSPTNKGGYAYVSNAEVGKKGGGVGSIIFDANGNPIDYKMILTGTTRNCGGGKTYWQTVGGTCGDPW